MNILKDFIKYFSIACAALIGCTLLLIVHDFLGILAFTLVLIALAALVIAVVNNKEKKEGGVNF